MSQTRSELLPKECPAMRRPVKAIRHINKALNPTQGMPAALLELLRLRSDAFGHAFYAGASLLAS